MPFIRDTDSLNIIFASKQKHALLTEKAELCQLLENLEQQTDDAEAELAAGIADGSLGDSDKADLIDQLKDLCQQTEDADEELQAVIDRCVELGIGASTELDGGDDDDRTESELTAELKALQTKRDAGEATEADSKRADEILTQLASIAKGYDPKEAVKSRRFTSLKTGEQVVLTGVRVVDR